MVVHGEDGMDEITTTGGSRVAEWVDGRVRQYTLHPEEFGIPVATVDALRGGTAEENARIILEMFEGRKGAKRDIVLLNAGAALHAAGSADTIDKGIELAGQVIDEGKAMEKLQAMIRHSNRQ
jgi:anthranilate phosphoribosyltransferase